MARNSARRLSSISPVSRILRDWLVAMSSSFYAHLSTLVGPNLLSTTQQRNTYRNITAKIVLG
jgi:hypothetical protein